MPAPSPRPLNPYLAPALISVILVVGHLSFGILESVGRTALAIATSIGLEVALGLALRGRVPPLASAYISGISVGILIRSPLWWPYAACSALSITSKYALRAGERHLWNPSNFGVSAILFLAPSAVASLSIQWDNRLWAMLVIWTLGGFIIHRLGRFHICVAYALTFFALGALRAKLTGVPVLAAVAPITGPMYQLFVLFMITDPKTTVGGRRAQCVVAVLVGVVEALLRVGEVVHAPYYALFVVGPSASMVELWLGRRGRAAAGAGTGAASAAASAAAAPAPPPASMSGGAAPRSIALGLAAAAGLAGCGGGGGGGAAAAGGAAALPAIDLAVAPAQGARTVFGRDPGAGDIGLPVEAGDLDGDGHADVAIGQIIAAAGPASDRARAGRTTVVFGDGALAGAKDLAIDLTDTLVIEGADPADYVGTELAFGDVSGDGVDDLVIGVQFADGAANGRPTCGEVWVVLGGAGLRAAGSIDLASPPASGLIRVIGAASGDRLGIYVDAADVTGDGVADLILGADLADGPAASGRTNAGAVYVLAGLAPPDALPAEIDLAAPPAGVEVFVIHGAASGDSLGATVYGLDVDGDGTADVVASATLNRLSAGQAGFPGQGGADGPPGSPRTNAGAVHVIFGGPALGASGALDLAVASTTFATVHGAQAGDAFGEEVALGDLGAGPALVVGAFAGDGPPGSPRGGAGEAYVIPAAAITPGAVIDIASPPAGTTAIFGASANDLFSDGLRVADVDGDGTGDLVASSPRALAAGRAAAGIVYVLLGGAGGLAGGAPVIDLAAPPAGLSAVLLLGARSGDNLGYTLTVADLDGDARFDVVTNVMRGDGLGDAIAEAGDVALVGGAAIADEVEP